MNNQMYIFNRGILRNLYKGLIQFEGIDFVSSEHAYQRSGCAEELREDLVEEVMKAKIATEA